MGLLLRMNNRRKCSREVPKYFFSEIFWWYWGAPLRFSESGCMHVNACVKIMRPGVCDVPLLWWGSTLCLQYHYYYVLFAEATTTVDESGKTWQLLSNTWCYFWFICSLLSAVSYITGGSSFWQHSRQLLLFISSVVCVPLNVPTDFSDYF